LQSISSFTKIRSVGTELFYADGRSDEHIDMAKLIVTFHKFKNLSKKEINLET